MMSPIRFKLTVLAAFTSIAAPLSAQSMSRDAGTGDIVVTYEIDGDQFAARIPGADQISPTMEVIALSTESGGYTYRLRLANGTASPARQGRGIRLISIPCADDSHPMTVGVAQPTGWGFRAQDGLDGRKRCQFFAGRSAVLDPGSAVDSLTLRTSALPGIGIAYVYGIGGMVEMATGEETPDTVLALLVAAGREGVHVTTLLPVRSPSEVATVGAAVQILGADLDRLCGELGWIDNPGVCQSFRAKLSAASSALGRGNSGTVRNQLSAFRSHLEAQRGKHVSENGYALLRAVAERALELLQ